MSQLPCPDSKDPLKLLCEHAQRGTELRDKGFTKLVRRDDGIYENATAVTERLGMSDLTSPKRSRISRRSSGINADP